jgi:TPR repeat protein
MANWLNKSLWIGIGSFLVLGTVDYVRGRVLEGGESWLVAAYDRIAHGDDIDAFQDGMRRLIRADKLSQTDPAGAAAAYESAVSALKKSADGGYPEAMLKYGELLCVGRIPYVEPNLMVALVYLGRAVEAGEPKASMTASMCSAKG